MRRLLTRTAATAALLALPLAACGGGSSTAGGGGGGDCKAADGSKLAVHAKDNLKFDAGCYTAKAGDISFDYIDDGSLAHTLLIDGKGDFRLQVAGSGNTQSGSTNLPAGTYTLFCDIPGHRGSGMEAKLTVS